MEMKISRNYLDRRAKGESVVKDSDYFSKTMLSL